MNVVFFVVLQDSITRSKTLLDAELCDLFGQFHVSQLTPTYLTFYHLGQLKSIH